MRGDRAPGRPEAWRGVLALLALVGGLVGVPVLLWHLGNPIAGVRLAQSWQILLLQPEDGTLLRTLLTGVAWIGWSVFALSVITETITVASRQRIRLRWPALASTQHLAAMLLLAVLALAATIRFTPQASVGVPSAVPAVAAPHTTEPGALAQQDDPVRSSATSLAREAETGRSSPPVRPLAVPGETAAPPEVPAAAAPSGAAVQEHLVVAGDDLWSLAERYYGSGAAWRSIAQANPAVLSGGPDRLVPGWRLRIPSATDANETERHITIRRGDTLSGLAAEHLGSADRWRELYRINRVVISDPDRLSVGLRLQLPKTSTTDPAARSDAARAEGTRSHRDRAHRPASPPQASASRSARAAETPAPTTPAPTGSAQPSRAPIRPAEPVGTPPPESVAPTTGVTPTTAPTSRSNQPTASTSTSDLPTASSSARADASATGASRSGGATQPPAEGPPASPAERDIQPMVAAGLGGAVAAALLAGLALRRRHQLAARPVGRRITHPSAEARHFEAGLGRRHQPASLRAVDGALRALAAHRQRSGQPAPALQSLTVDHHSVALHLSDPRGAAPPDFHVVDDRWTIEVASAASWATDPGLADVLRPYPALVGLGSDEDGRTLMVDLEECRTVDVRLDPPHTEGLLRTLIAELSFAPWADEVTVTVVGGDGGWCEALDRPSVLHDDDLDEVLDRLDARAAVQARHAADPVRALARLTPDLAAAWTPEVLIVMEPPTPAQARRLVDLLHAEPRVTAAAVVAGPLSGAQYALTGGADEAVLDPPGRRLRPQTLRPTELARLQDLVAATGDTRTTPAPWWSGATSSAPAPRGVWGSTLDSEGSTDVHDQEGRAAGAHHPLLRMLGPIDLCGAAGTLPSRAAKQCLEYCAWLLEHPGTTAMAMAAALSVAEGTRRSNMSRLRTWLGTDREGKLYLPDAYSGHIVLHSSVSSDWQRLQILTVGGVDKTSSEGLRAALTLVRGAPLADAAPGQWHWAEELRTDMISAVRDIGLQLGERALAAGDLDLARWATARALTAAPADERLMTLRIRTEHRAGNAVETERLTLQLAAQARAIGVDLDPVTVTTLQEVLEGRARARVPV